MTNNGGKPRHDKERIPRHWNGQHGFGIHTQEEIQEWLNHA